MTEKNRKQIRRRTAPDGYPRGRELREVAGVVVLVTGPDATRLADLFAALVPRLSSSDRRAIGALVLVECDPEAERKRRLLEGNWAFARRVGGTNTLLLRREVTHLPDAALAFLLAHEAARLVHYGRGDFDHDEKAVDPLAASWGGPTLADTWRAFRDGWAHVPEDERGGIPAWSEGPDASEGGGEDGLRSCSNRELKLTAALYASRSSVVEHVRATGRLPEKINLGGAHIGARLLIEARGTDITLTPDEELVYAAIVRDRRLPGGAVRLVTPESPDRRGGPALPGGPFGKRRRR